MELQDRSGGRKVFLLPKHVLRLNFITKQEESAPKCTYVGRGLKRSDVGARDAFNDTTMVSPRVYAAEGQSRMLNESTVIPEVLFLIPSQYFTLIINEISNVMQLILPGHFILMCFHYRARHYAYFELFCQLLISVQIIVPLLAKGKKLRVFGHPVCEMIFGENSEVGAF